MKKRENWIDIAKGIGIILVVISHSGNDIAHHYFFWFHMPLFFLLSGYTFKEISNKTNLKSWITKILFKSLVPYISFGIFIFIIYTLVTVITNDFDWDAYLISILNMFYGGQLLKGYFGVFWFITCLLITQILFALILYLFKSHLLRIFVILFLFVIAHIEAYYLPTDFAIPLNADVALFSILYFSLGWYLKIYAAQFFRNSYFFTIAAASSFFILLFEYFGYFNYELDMKYRIYSNLLLDLFIPVLFSFLILFISVWLTRIQNTKVLAAFGQKSLSIMYLHIPINIIFQTVFSEYHWLIYTLLGVSLPLIFTLLSARVAFTNFIFSGTPLISFKKGNTRKVQ